MTRGSMARRGAATKPRRHLFIPDTQIRPGVPTQHIDWAARAIVDYRPDVIVVAGDWWDMPSCSTHSEPGSLEKEGARVKADIDVGNEAFARLVAPMRKLRGYRPRCEFLFGNHEHRFDRLIEANPKLQGALSRDQMLTPGFNRNEFLEIVEIDGIWYSHYFANVHSGRPIGGNVDNRLNKIGNSFVAGHEQGLLYGCRQFPGARRRHGLVAGSFYQHTENYRGAQGRDEWRGIVVLNEVHDGDYCVMPLTLDYLKRKYNCGRRSA